MAWPQITDGTNTQQFFDVALRMRKFGQQAEALPERPAGTGRAGRRLGSSAGRVQATCRADVTLNNAAAIAAKRTAYKYFQGKIVTFTDPLEVTHENILIKLALVQFRQVANGAGGLVGSAATHEAIVVFHGEDLSSA